MFCYNDFKEAVALCLVNLLKTMLVDSNPDDGSFFVLFLFFPSSQRISLAEIIQNSNLFSQENFFHPKKRLVVDVLVQVHNVLRNRYDRSSASWHITYKKSKFQNDPVDVVKFAYINDKSEYAVLYLYPNLAYYPLYTIKVPITKRKQYHNFSVLSVTCENELQFPVPTPQAISKLNNLHHSAVGLASIFVYLRLSVSIIEMEFILGPTDMPRKN